jgi:hypothetical protein
MSAGEKFAAGGIVPSGGSLAGVGTDKGCEWIIPLGDPQYRKALEAMRRTFDGDDLIGANVD